MEYKGFFLFDDLFYWNYPESISLEVSNLCNLRCSHCFQSYFEFPRGHLMMEVWEKIKPYISKDKIPSVTLSSAGEPLMSPNFRKIFYEIRQRGVTTGITTNGHLLRNFIDDFVGRLNHLAVSLDAINPALYKQRRRAPVEKVVQNLLSLKTLKQEKNTDLPEISFIVVVNRENVFDLVNIIDFAKKIRANNVIVYHQIFYQKKEFREKSLFFKPEIWDLSLKKSIDKAQKNHIVLIHPGTFDGRIAPHPAANNYLTGDIHTPICNWIFKTTTISWNGYVQACCFCDRLFMGQIKKEDFKDIWNGPSYRKLRLCFLQKKLNPACKNCQFLQVLSLDKKEAFLCEHHQESFYNEKALVKGSSISLDEANNIYLQGLQKLTHNNFQESIQIFSYLQEKEPTYFEALNALAVALFLNQKKSEAKKTISKALSIFPKEKHLIQNREKIYKL